MLTSSCHSKSSGSVVQTAFALLISISLAACGDDLKPPPPPPEPLHVLAAGAMESSVDDMIGTFEMKTGLTVDASFGSAGAVRDQIKAGAAIDVAIITPAAISPLVDLQLVLGARVDLGRIGGGIAVRANSVAPSITNEVEFKEALLAADEVYYADPTKATAGAAFVNITKMLDIADAVSAKSKLASGGKEAMQKLGASTALHAIGVTQLSEIYSVPQVKLVGEYPGTLQIKTTYASIVLANSARAEDAQKLMDFFAGPEFQARLAESGFEPLAATGQ